MEAQGKPLGLPDVQAGRYLINALFEAGPTEYHATGQEIAITWQTLHAYAQITQELTEPWEYRAVMKMSAAYMAGKTDGTDLQSEGPKERKTK